MKPVMVNLASTSTPGTALTQLAIMVVPASTNLQYVNMQDLIQCSLQYCSDKYIELSFQAVELPKAVVIGAMQDILMFSQQQLVEESELLENEQLEDKSI